MTRRHVSIALLFFVVIHAYPWSKVYGSTPQQIEDAIYDSLIDGNIDTSLTAYRRVLDARTSYLKSGDANRKEHSLAGLSADTGGLVSMIRLLESMAQAITWLRQEEFEEAASELLTDYIKGAKALDYYSISMADAYMILGGDSHPAAPLQGPAWLEWYREKGYRETIRARLEKCAVTLLAAAQLIGEDSGYEEETKRFFESARSQLPIGASLSESLAVYTSTRDLGEVKSLSSLAATVDKERPLTDAVAKYLMNLYRDLEKGDWDLLSPYVGRGMTKYELEPLRATFKRFSGWRFKGARRLAVDDIGSGRVMVRVEGVLLVSHVGTRLRSNHAFELIRQNGSLLLNRMNGV